MAALGTNTKVWQNDTPTGFVRRREDGAVVYSCCSVSRKSYSVTWTMSRLQGPSGEDVVLAYDVLYCYGGWNGFVLAVVVVSTPCTLHNGFSIERQLKIPSRSRRGSHNLRTVVFMKQRSPLENQEVLVSTWNFKYSDNGIENASRNQAMHMEAKKIEFGDRRLMTSEWSSGQSHPKATRPWHLIVSLPLRRSTKSNNYSSFFSSPSPFFKHTEHGRGTTACQSGRPYRRAQRSLELKHHS